MQFKNQVARYGHYVVTEETNCYCVWYLEFGTNCYKAIPFMDSKDGAYNIALSVAKEQHRINK